MALHCKLCSLPNNVVYLRRRVVICDSLYPSSGSKRHTGYAGCRREYIENTYSFNSAALEILPSSIDGM